MILALLKNTSTNICYIYPYPLIHQVDYIIPFLFFFNVTCLVSGDLLFKKLRSYVLTETQLVDNGYPRPAPGKPGQAVVKWSHYDKILETKGVYVCSAAFRMLSIVVCLVQAFCSYRLY